MNSLRRSLLFCYPRPTIKIQCSSFHSTVSVMLPKVVATRRLLPDSQARLERLKNIELVQWQGEHTMPREQLLESVKGADALICMLSDKIDKQVFDAAGPQLKLVTTLSVGHDHIDLKTAREKKIKIGYTPDVLTDATADLAALLTLAAARNMKQGIDAVQNGGWQDWRAAWLCGYQFTNKTLGVVGLGRIGQAVAKRLGAFGINRLIYSGRTKKEGVDGELVPLDQLLKEADFIVVCCSLTSDTKEMFDYDAFKKMKKNAIFVNISRGGVVKQADLAQALKEKLIAGAGLDVTTPEPLPLDDPLQSLDNCVVLPHIGSATWDTRSTMSDMMVDNVLAVLENKTIPYELK
ncbi:D-isomer specific 2-hydroxyacid dehydrogenase [Halteromyces radiatus]|uniref:D-isomer specific 2-hydroxyacid dehydrogenase n=1 Tax=Halteromyces radiatus TaxID=101107 RepID=UPI00221F9630|nr:D-isomer specific 2-hydroxyacid dehydrogenase [Halteromyces radiatus]KAI8093435.1 D-isomer specific 2-hydroxyacid dehydrogenase [Halteromyces radiatus]